MLWGSRIVRRYLFELFSEDSEIVGVVGPSISGTIVLPPGMAVPALLFHTEQALYSGSVGRELAEHVSEQSLRATVRVLAEGTSTLAIEPVADRQADLLLDGQEHSITVDGDGTYFMTFSANSEVLPENLVDRQQTAMYSQLGTVYDITLMRGG